MKMNWKWVTPPPPPAPQYSLTPYTEVTSRGGGGGGPWMTSPLFQSLDMSAEWAGGAGGGGLTAFNPLTPH